MPIGDSDEVRSGDDVTVLGFPGIAGSARISVTNGVISTFIDREDLGPRSEIDTDARIAPGNSGGAAIDNDAKLIGIPSALFAPDGSPVVSGRIRPINFVMDMIEDAEQEGEPSGSASSRATAGQQRRVGGSGLDRFRLSQIHVTPSLTPRCRPCRPARSPPRETRVRASLPSRCPPARRCPPDRRDGGLVPSVDERKRPGDRDAVARGDVAEVFVEAQHRRVAGLRPGVDLFQSVESSPVQGSALEM